MQPGGRRYENIDALRGLSLFGILQVNIQSFTWGPGEPLAYLPASPDAATSALYFLQAAFFEGKFYPIFGFLFGVGIALQLRKLRSDRPGDAAAAYRRRLLILFALGVAHGLLLYCGDVLSAYALCALAFVTAVPLRGGAVLRAAPWLWLAALASVFLPLLFEDDPNGIDDAGRIPAGALLAHDIYSEAGFAGQLHQHFSDELWQQLVSIPFFWTQILALFALGVLAGRLGWLQHPQRHPAVWRCAWRLGLLVGLPCALGGAALALARVRDMPAAQGAWDSVLLGMSSLLAAAYVAGAVRAFQDARTARLRGWLACAGRMSLSNYVGQSLAMGLLLSGWGLGLGATAGRGTLTALAIAIFAVQLLLSRAVFTRFRQGPLEFLWRRASYGAASLRRAAPDSQRG